MTPKSSVRTTPENEARKVITWFVSAEAILLVGNLLIRISAKEKMLPSWMNAAIAIMISIPMIILAMRFFQILRSTLDEMLQRIVVEGLAFAMIVFIPLAGLYVNLRATGLFLRQVDPPELLLIPSILAIIGFQISWSRLK